MPAPLLLLQPAAKYLLAALVITALLFGCYMKGRSDGRDLVAGQLATQRLEWQAKVSELQLAYQKDADKAAAEYAKVSSDLRNQINKLKNNPQVVTKYIPVQVDTLVPKGLVALHDRAASGENLDADVDGAGDPSSIRVSSLGTTVAGNYFSCADDRARLRALQTVVQGYMEAQKELTK